MLLRTFASSVAGIDAVTITIELNLSRGVRFFLVGLPDVAVKESQQRIESAIRSLGFRWPGRQVVINMAPADIRKEGSSYDLPLAIGILAADEKVSGQQLDSFILIGELSLDGSLQPVRGVLPIAMRAREEKFRGVIVPEKNAREAAVVDGLGVGILPPDLQGQLLQEYKRITGRKTTPNPFAIYRTSRYTSRRR